MFRVLAEDANGDMVLGTGNDLLIDTPAAVGQAVKDRLLLFVGEWFIDTNAGTPWLQQILQNSTPSGRDTAIRQRILGTPFVNNIIDYASSVDVRTRSFSVSCKIDTAFGTVEVTIPFVLPKPQQFQIGVSPAGGTAGAG